MLVLVMSVAFGFSLGACKRNVPIIATVGGKKITENVLNKKLLKTPAEYQKFANTHFGRKQFIDAVLMEAIVIESAKKAGIEKQKEYKNAVKNFQTKQKQQFADYKNGLLIETYVKEIYKKIKPNDTDVLKYYNVNKSVFKNHIAYTVRHILVYDTQTAQNAIKRLKNCESFEKVAKEVSLDGNSAANGGLIKPFKRGDLLPEFENVVANLKNNEISGIVETPYGYHIILKISERKLPSISFDEAKDKIKRTLEKERFDAWFAQEKEKLKVKINYDIASYAAGKPQK
ncbi:MAG: peptidylprolyl isomerase [Endomicrobium sp.]|nr:peptidylprolyl isomerase [Endomicrobium sp.]